MIIDLIAQPVIFILNWIFGLLGTAIMPAFYDTTVGYLFGAIHGLSQFPVLGTIIEIMFWAMALETLIFGINVVLKIMNILRITNVNNIEPAK